MVRRSIFAIAALLAFSAPALALDVQGVDGKMVSLSEADFAKLPRVKVSVTQHGKKHAFEGPLLMHVLKFVSAPSGETLKGKALTDVVIVTAKDGYQAALSLAEADPAMRKERVIVADKMDGAALPTDDGPYRLVIEGDMRPARAVRMIERIALARIERNGATP